MSDRGEIPACAAECGTFLRDWISKVAVLTTGFASEATVSHLPPLVPSGYEPVAMSCPHGVKWYAEPTSEQIAEWARDGVE